MARRQLTHLLELSDRPNAAVRVIPFKAGGFPGAGQSIIYAEASVPQLDLVELDSTHGPDFLDSDLQLKKYRAQLAELETVALSTSDSRDFIVRLARQL